MRPEIAAFRELEVLVRNLGDQLAGYRKRALTAEGKCRELEGALAAARTELERSSAIVSTQAPATATATSDDALRLENQELLVRLEQARERTVQVVDRVRFLRQQMTVEK